MTLYCLVYVSSIDLCLSCGPPLRRNVSAKLHRRAPSAAAYAARAARAGRRVGQPTPVGRPTAAVDEANANQCLEAGSACVLAPGFEGWKAHRGGEQSAPWPQHHPGLGAQANHPCQVLLLLQRPVHVTDTRTVGLACPADASRLVAPLPQGQSNRQLPSLARASPHPHLRFAAACTARCRSPASRPPAPPAPSPPAGCPPSTPLAAAACLCARTRASRPGIACPAAPLAEQAGVSTGRPCRGGATWKTRAAGPLPAAWKAR